MPTLEKSQKKKMIQLKWLPRNTVLRTTKTKYRGVRMIVEQALYMANLVSISSTPYDPPEPARSTEPEVSPKYHRV